MACRPRTSPRLGASGLGSDSVRARLDRALASAAPTDALPVDAKGARALVLQRLCLHLATMACLGLSRLQLLR